MNAADNRRKRNAIFYFNIFLLIIQKNNSDFFNVSDFFNSGEDNLWYPID